MLELNLILAVRVLACFGACALVFSSSKFKTAESKLIRQSFLFCFALNFLLSFIPAFGNSGRFSSGRILYLLSSSAGEALIFTMVLGLGMYFSARFFFKKKKPLSKKNRTHSRKNKRRGKRKKH